MWLLSNKVLVKESGLLEGFCDYHCHLLPGVDDGVQELAETLDILRLWETVGVREVWLTPHMMEDIPNTTNTLRERFEELGQAYEGSITVRLAAENMLDNLFAERFATGDVLTLGMGEKTLLVETSYYNPPINMNQVIANIKAKGYTPLLAHPERYQYMGMDDYVGWKREGVLLQLNIPSLIGAYGPMVQKKARLLLENGLYDCAGTDTHSLSSAELFLDSLINKKTVERVRRINETLYR